MTSWTEVLDDLERRVEEAEAALDNDELLPVDAFVPPADIEPLPAELHERALDVLRRHAELEQRVENLLQSVTRDLGVTTRASRAASAFTDSKTPSFVDSKA